jgi:hypothetical protein
MDNFLIRETVKSATIGKLDIQFSVLCFPCALHRRDNLAFCTTGAGSGMPAQLEVAGRRLPAVTAQFVLPVDLYLHLRVLIGIILGLSVTRLVTV